MVSPALTEWAPRMRYCAVSPFKITAAAVSSSMKSGNFTSRVTGITVACEYARGFSDA
jgi:hypothetical protein